MDEQELAAQLRKPTGDLGVEIGEFMAKGNRSFYDALMNFSFFKEISKVLEIGMGSGEHIKELIEKNQIQNYCGLDYSEVMISESKKNNKNLSSSKFILADAAKMPFQNHSFDLIFTINTLYFYENPLLVFDEIQRLLKPNGKFIIGKRTYNDLISLGAITRFGFMNYTNDEVIALLRQSKFKVDNHQVFNEKPTQLNNTTLNLHNEFYICSKY